MAVAVSKKLNVLELFKSSVEMYKKDWKKILVPVFKIILLFFAMQVALVLGIFAISFVPLIGELFGNAVSFVVGSALSALMILQFFNAIKQYLEKKSFPGTISFFQELLQSNRWHNLFAFELLASIAMTLLIVGTVILGTLGLGVGAGLSALSSEGEMNPLMLSAILSLIAGIFIVAIVFSLIYNILFFALPACAFYEKSFVEMVKKAASISTRNILQMFIFYIILFGINALVILILISPLLIAGFSSMIAWAAFAILALLALGFYVLFLIPWSTLFTYLVQYELGKIYKLGEKSK